MRSALTAAQSAAKNTTIPMLPSIKVENLTVAKPVKDAAAAAATTADSAYTVAYTEWTAADGTSLVIGDKFQPGTVYTAKITLETSGSGVFSAKSTYNPIEGKTATATPVLTGDTHADSVILSYTFDATEGSTGGSTGGGGGSGGGGVTTYAITVKDSKNGDVTASHKSAAKGTTVTLTVDPDKGYVLDTLTVLDDKDKEIKLTEKNGKYVFTMPSGKVTVAGRFKVEQPAGKHPFTDIPSGAYYENAVIWAADKGITGGTSATTFAPNGICTRARAVTFLWRAAGSPAPKSMNSFADVPADAYYAKAVAWAVENGITSGTGGGKVQPRRYLYPRSDRHLPVPCGGQPYGQRRKCIQRCKGRRLLCRRGHMGGEQGHHRRDRQWPVRFRITTAPAPRLSLSSIGIWNNNRIFLPSGAVNAAPLFCVLSEKLPAAGRAQNSSTR